MSDEIVHYEARYPAAIITLNNPRTRNAISMPMVDAMMEALQKAEDDPNIRALILTGSGSAFCAGMDLKELHQALDTIRFGRDGAVWEDARRGEDLIDRVYTFSKPTIAAVNGDAAAAGAGLVSACDMVVAAPEARIGYPEMRRGIQAGMVLIHLMRLVGERQARFLVLTGELVSAVKAKEMGIINEVVPRDELLPTAFRWATSVGMNAPKAEMITKDLLRKFSSHALAMAMREYKEAPHITDECREGLEAFFAKRPVPWAPQ